MMLQSSNESLAAFTRELEFRAELFRKPLDATALKTLGPSEVFRAARLAGADSELIKEYITALAARKVHLSDDDGDGGVRLVSEDGILLLADAKWAEWSDCWQAAHADGQNNSLKSVHRIRSLPMHSGSPGTRNRSEDSHTSHHSHPHHYRYGASDPESGRSERHTEDSPSLVRISVDLLTGGKSITAVMDPLSTVLDLKQRINDREKIPPCEQVLFFGREKMRDQRTLHSYNVKEGSHLVLSPTVIAGTL